MTHKPHQSVPVSRIRTDGDTQARLQLDQIAVHEYAQAMKAGDKFPWLTLYWDGENYWLADGFHRVAAAKAAGIDELSCYVNEGDRRDALLYAAGCNASFGVRRTNADKRRAVTLLLEDKEWARWNDAKIAHHVGVSDRTVANIRKELSPKISEIAQPRLVTRNGRTYEMDTAAIGRGSEPDTEEPEPAGFDWEEVEEEEEAAVPPFSRTAPGEMLVARGADATGQPGQPAPLHHSAATHDSTPAINIVNGDAQRVAEIVSATVHLVVTSPPYNVGIDYDASSDNLLTYLPMLQNVWRGCHEVMADGARICVVVPFGVGRNPYTPFDCQIMETLTNVGFSIRGRIVWDKNTTGNRTSWGSWRTASSPSLRDTTECIIVAHKGGGVLSIPPEQIKRDEKGKYTEWLAEPDYFMELAQDHWAVAPESAQRVKHPAPFPVELVSRLLHFYAYPGCHILDPFGGSGTTGVAAKRLGCSATLIDMSANYCALARERIDNA